MTAIGYGPMANMQNESGDGAAIATRRDTTQGHALHGNSPSKCKRGELYDARTVAEQDTASGSALCLAKTA